MSKRLHLGVLGSPKRLRSGRKVVDQASASETSKYFEKVDTNVKTKKRAPVVVEYDEPKNEDVEKLSVDGKKWTPPGWQAILRNIQEMRKEGTAPVDTMGCHTCADSDADPSVSRYQTLLALMLSSQTKDEVTSAAMGRVKSHGCTPTKMLNISDEDLGKLIYPVSFWKRKVQYIKRTSEILIDQYKGDIPDTIEGLCKLPGVGPKMGHLCMQVAWGKVSGIGVDTHVHRISNRLQWVRKQTKTPEETRKELEDWLPKEMWTTINHLLVGFGQEICLPRFPKCNDCLNKQICPYAKKNHSTKK